MNAQNTVLGNVQDHVMANTWRLIFERPYDHLTPTTPLPTPDFSRLAEVLPEYRLIGLAMAINHSRRYQ